MRDEKGSTPSAETPSDLVVPNKAREPAVPVGNPNRGLARSADDTANDIRIQQAYAFAIRIRKALSKIDEASHPAMRAILGAYYQRLNPKLALFGQQDFPKTVRRHARSQELSTEYNKPMLLFFSVGNAILGMYDLYLGKSVPTLESRVALLEGIAKEGLSNFAIDGDDSLGYSLVFGS